MRNKLTLDIIREKFRQIGGQPDQITESYLRMDQILDTTKALTFNPRKDQNMVTSSEIRLSTNDVFTMTDIALRLYKVAGTEDNANDVAKSVPYTYPNPFIFNGVTTVTEADELETIYNGFLKLVAGTTVWIPKFPLRSLYRVPQVQKGEVLTEIVDVAGTGLETQRVSTGEWSGYDYGYAPLLPSFNLSGQQDVNFELNFPQSGAMSGQDTTINILSLEVKGFLISQVNESLAKQMQGAWIKTQEMPDGSVRYY